MLVGMDESLDLALNSGELSGISDISPPRGHHPAMVAMARSMEGFDDCEQTPSGSDLHVLQMELEAEEAAQ